MTKPSGAMLRALYDDQRLSPERIGEIYCVSGRTVRNWMKNFLIERRGPSHLRAGISATWNVGLKRSAESIEKNRKAHTGRKPHNFGAGNISFVCEVCRKPVVDKPYRRKRVCSASCRDALSTKMRGEAHWNYRGDDTSYKQRARLWAQTKEWRVAVLLRDGACLSCGTSNRLSAHHLASWEDRSDLRFDPSNGVTLCVPCHVRFHKETSYRHATPEMFFVWVTRARPESNAQPR